MRRQSANVSRATGAVNDGRALVVTDALMQQASASTPRHGGSLRKIDHVILPRLGLSAGRGFFEQRDVELEIVRWPDCSRRGEILAVASALQDDPLFAFL